MRKRFFIIFLSVVSFFILLTIYSQKGKKKSYKDPTHYSVLKLSLRTEPLSLDPRKNSDGITSLFFLFISDGLMRIGQDGKPEFALAEKVEISGDQKEYTFHLREAFWSNGEPITSYQFKKSWKASLDPSFAAYNPDYFFVIKNAKKAYESKVKFSEVGIETPDERTLKVILEHPTPYFLELVANKSFLPVFENIDGKRSLSSSGKWLIASGPFMIKKWIYQDKILLKKNPYYWDKKAVKLDKIELHIIEDEIMQLTLFEMGKLDWIGAPFSFFPLDSLNEIKKNPFFGTFPTASLYFYSFNTTKYPLDHPKIRKALTYAMHREELIEHISQGKERPAFSLIPFKMQGIHKDYFKDNDSILAKKLFKEALEELELTLETFPRLVLSYPSIQSRHVMAQAVQQQWQNVLGLKVELEGKEWQLFLNDINQKNYQIGALGRGTHHLDPIHFLSLFKNKNQISNRPGWENEEYTALLEQSYSIVDQKLRYEKLQEAEKIFMDQMPIAPIFFPTNYYLKNPHLKNVLMSDIGMVDFKKAFFE